MKTVAERRLEASWEAVVLLLGLVLASVGAPAHAGSWNDSSRLATAECLADQGTWSIDESVFVAVPAPGTAPPPYPPDDRALMTYGTRDKLRIRGHFYSDKPPVAALLLAAEYRAWRAVSGASMRSRADRACALLTVGSSGLAYVLALWCLFRLGGVLELALPWRLLLTASLAVGSLAWPYALAINGHELLLAVTLAMLLLMAGLARVGAPALGRIAALGALGGLGYTLDLGAGPVLLVGAGLWVLWRVRRVRAVALFSAAALPGLVLHHTLNYVVAGSWVPANAVPAYFDWPGCPFDATSMTGRWNHPGPGSFLLYALALLAGKKGFLLHNPPLLLALVGPPLLLRLRRLRETPELLLGLVWSVGIWLLYAATSRNSSGLCCSVRWFVPLLGPGYFTLAVLLRDCPRVHAQFLTLAVGGVALAAPMAWYGPWMRHMVPGYWFLVAATLTAWGVTAWRSREVRQKPGQEQDREVRQAA